MQFSPLFLKVLVVSAVVLAAVGVLLLAALFVTDTKRKRLW